MKHVGKIAALAVAAALAITGCSSNAGGGSSAATSAKGGTLTILSSSTSVNFDPAKSQSLAITSLGLVERRLTTWETSKGSPAKVVPDLATTTGTASDGGKTWTFTLKSGLKFADGTPITAQDVKYGIERSFAPELSGGLGYHKTLLVGGDTYTGPYKGGDLASIATPDATTIVFHLNKPYGDWPWVASTPAFAPVPKAKDNPTTYTRNPVATGPYQVASYKEGASIVLTRNKYWNNDTVRTAGPDKIVWKLGQDPAVSAQSLAADTGEAQTSFSADFVPAAQLAQIGSNPQAKTRLVTSGDGALAYLALNTQSAALKNVKVRQAIEYAVDKKSYLIASGGSVSGDYATTLITPGIAGREVFDLYKADPTGDVAKAKSLLAAAGSPSLKLTLLTQNDGTSLTQAQAIQAGLKRAGITVTLKPEESSSFYADATGDKANYDLVLSSWQPDFPSANGNISPLFASNQIGGGNFNLSRYSNAAVDTLIDQATAEVDPAKAGQLWAQADRRILEDAPVVPLIYTKNSFLHGSKVGNFAIGDFPAYPNYLKVTITK